LPTIYPRGGETQALSSVSRSGREQLEAENQPSIRVVPAKVTEPFIAEADGAGEVVSVKFSRLENSSQFRFWVQPTERR
jgi:hypothetical protein